MGAQLALLDYVAPVRITAAVRGESLVVKATGGPAAEEHLAAFDALVDTLNRLDLWVSVLRVGLWPHREGAAWAFRCVMVAGGAARALAVFNEQVARRSLDTATGHGTCISPAPGCCPSDTSAPGGSQAAPDAHAATGED